MSTIKKIKKAVVATGLTVTTTVWLSSAVLLAPVAAAYSDGDLLKDAASSNIYVVNNGMKVWVRSAAVFEGCGYAWGDVKTVSDLSAVSQADLIKNASNPDVYRLEKDFKRKLASIEIFEAYNLDWNKVATVCNNVLDSYSIAPLMKQIASPDIYWVKVDGLKHKMTSWDSFVENGFNIADVIEINAMEMGSYAEGDAVYATGTTPIPPVGTGLTVAKASDSPASTSVPKDAANVTYLKFNLTAGSDGAVTVDSLTLTRRGVGAAADFDNIYLYEGDNRLTSGRTVSTQTQQSAFPNLGLSVPAGSTKTLSVVAEMASNATAGDVNYFEITAGSDVSTTATVSGSFPVAGSAMTVAAQSVGSLTIATSGAISDPYVGSKQAEVSRLRLTAGSEEDVDFQRIILTNAGSISSADLTNFKLYMGAELLGSASAMTSDRVSITLTSPYKILKGQNRTFNIKADMTGRPAETIKLYLEYTTDLYGVGKTYGGGVGVTNSFASTDITAANNLLTLNGGKVTTAMSGPSAGKMKTTAQDVSMLEYTMTVTQDVEVRSTKIYLCWDDTGNGDYDNLTSTTQDDITDVKLLNADTGGVLAGPTDGSSFTLDASATTVCGDSAISAYYTWTDYYDINDGESLNLKIALDLTAAQIAATDKLKVVLDEFGATEIKSRVTNDYIAAADIVPSSDISGNAMTVQASSLALALASSPVASTYVKGATAKDFVGILFTAGESSDIEVTSIKVSAYVDDTASGVFIKDTDGTITAQNIVDNVKLMDGETQIGSTKSIDSDGEVNFTNLSWTVTAGATKKLVVRADVSRNAPENGASDRIKFDIADADVDVTAYDSDSASVDATNDTVNGGTADSGTIITISSAGSLYAQADADTPLSDIVVMGATGVSMAKIKFTSVNEGFTVKKVRLDNATTNMAGTAITAGTYDDNIKAVKITYPTADGGSRTQVGAATSGIADFTGMTMYVPKDGSAVLEVSADLNTLTEGADSGDAPKFSLSVDAANDDEFEALSDGGTTINDDDVYMDGAQETGDDTIDSINQMVVRMTKPTITVDSAASSQLVNGTNTLIKFTVTADAKEDVALKLLSWDLSVNDIATSTALTLSSLAIYRSTNLTSALTAVIENGANATSWTNGSGQSIYLMFGSAASGEEVVPKGTSRTYYLKGTIASGTQSSSGDDSLTISFKSADTTTANRGITGGLDTTLGATTLAEVDNATISPTCYYVWSDNSTGVNHTSTDQTTYKDWTNGYLVKTLPSDSVYLEF